MTNDLSSPSPRGYSASYGRAGMCVFYGAGIIGSLVIYGILQERIMTGNYNGFTFKDSVFLVLCNRLFAVIFAAVMACVHGESIINKAPLWKYLAISLSNVYASTCQYEALKYVAFPVQMLGKSFKMLPVMVWGIIVSNKKYSLQDWLVAVAVTLGVTQFLMTGPISSNHKDNTSMFGLLLLLCFLILDGFTSTFQEKLFKEYLTSKYNQMFYVNLGSCAISVITLLATNTLFPALQFSVAHPALLVDASYLSASAVCGQFFILSQVKEFGALVFAATMNVRQVCSILLSYATYHHSITLAQCGGLFIVFAALFYKSYAGFRSDAAHHEITKKGDSETAPLVVGQVMPPDPKATKEAV